MGMKNMKIMQCVVGQIETNCYLLVNQSTKEILIVDPGDQPEKIIRAVDKAQGTPVAILLTHGHYDHILAVNKLKKTYPLRIYAYKDEERLLASPDWNLSGYGGAGVVVIPDVLLKDGQQVEAAGLSFQVIHTPGHTSGSCCYYFQKDEVLISGDTLFCESVGRTDFPTGSTGQIIDSLHKLLEQLPSQVEVLPGHGSSTTIEHEKRYNPFV
jgi:glyoxylase-like metal-dependent hydrolase (beta-lactamase superfamily II)